MENQKPRQVHRDAIRWWEGRGRMLQRIRTAQPVDLILPVGVDRQDSMDASIRSDQPSAGGSAAGAAAAAGSAAAALAAAASSAAAFFAAAAAWEAAAA